MKPLIKLILVFLIEYYCFDASAQGCSDAGFCTINSIKTKEITDTNPKINNQIKLGLSFGIAQNNVSIITPYTEYTRIFGNKISSTIKFLYSFHQGELANTQGLSDVIFSFNYKINENFNSLIGFKLPFSNSNISKYGINLPMAYQVSLGTYDYILGSNYKYKSISITAAYQQPITQNKNKFLVENYLENNIVSKYLSTNNYERSGDVLLRLSYYKQFKNNKLLLISSILPIYHLDNDKYENNSGNIVEISESKGLTLNLNLFLHYKLNKANRFEFSVGAPIISRNVRPDGLSQFSIGIEYVINF